MSCTTASCHWFSSSSKRSSRSTWKPLCFWAVAREHLAHVELVAHAAAVVDLGDGVPGQHGRVGDAHLAMVHQVDEGSNWYFHPSLAPSCSLRQPGAPWQDEHRVPDRAGPLRRRPDQRRPPRGQQAQRARGASRYAQKHKGFNVDRLDHFDEEENDWQEAVVETPARRRCPTSSPSAATSPTGWAACPVATAASPSPWRSATAPATRPSKFGVSEGRVSQLRKELSRAWRAVRRRRAQPDGGVSSSFSHLTAALLAAWAGRPSPLGVPL